MAISITPLTSGTGKYGSGNYNTASISANLGDVLCIAVTTANEAAPTISGLGLTWNMLNGQAIVDEGWNNCYISLWYAIPGSTVSGTISITAAAGSATDACAWSVFSIQGADTVSPFLQSGVAYGTGNGTTGPTVTVSLAAFSSPSNATLAIGGDMVYSPPNVEAGYTTVHSAQTDEAAIISAWLAGEDTTPTMDLATTATYYGIAVVAGEIKDVSAVGGINATGNVNNVSDSVTGNVNITAPNYNFIGSIYNKTDTIIITGSVIAPGFNALGIVDNVSDNVSGSANVVTPNFIFNGNVNNQNDGIIISGTINAPVFSANGSINSLSDIISGNASATIPTILSTGKITNYSDAFNISGVVVAPIFSGSGNVFNQSDSVNGLGTTMVPIYTANASVQENADSSVSVVSVVNPTFITAVITVLETKDNVKAFTSTTVPNFTASGNILLQSDFFSISGASAVPSFVIDTTVAEDKDFIIGTASTTVPNFIASGKVINTDDFVYDPLKARWIKNGEITSVWAIRNNTSIQWVKTVSITGGFGNA